MNGETSYGVRDGLPSAWTLLISTCAGVAGVAGSYAVAAFTPAFVAGPIAGVMARRMPDVLVRYAITVLGDLGDQLNIITALAVSIGLFAAAAVVGLVVAGRLDRPALSAPIGGVLVGAIAFGVTLASLAAVVAGLAAGLTLAVGSLASRTGDGGVSEDRRRVLGGVGSALVAVGGGYALGARGTAGGETGAAEPLDVPAGLRAEIDDLLGTAEDRSLGVDGIEPLVSEAFYEVDINATDPTVAADDWTLSVTGAVDEELTYDYEDVRALSAESRFQSLRCVGESLNGEKMDNALWTGVPIMDLVDPAGPAEECCVMLRAADGFFEEFPLPALEDGFLAFGMNGERLPRGHGYPARALIPGHWGEINVKWLTEIEVLTREIDGYWEKRGWHGTGPVNTVAKIHQDARLSDGRRQVGGHAYAGTRGVRAVEVSTDGGDTWAEATLSGRLPGEDVLRQWVYEYDAPAGDHEVVARAIEADGTVQPAEETDAFPSGPSGWVTRTISP
jgi:DMSO/TMAO reductase YedYZ molybdopterin-dependent catalytic subunit